RKSDYRLSTSLPEIPTTAWDVAVADQSIGWIESDALQRYSAAYTAVRSLGDLLQHDAILPLDAPRLVETMSDLQMERPVEPYVLLRSLRQMEAVVGSMVSSLQATADAIRPALSGASAAVASAPAPGSVPQKGGGS
ncbi:MAG TPA: hypothetical protein VMB48_14260, partial [Steroidobacteraceae bacterium]|nr:hypothetical protein [Steroidobacteraceae bacterium]